MRKHEICEAIIMALALAVVTASPLVIDLAVFLGFPAALGTVALVGQNWEDMKKYLSSGTLKMLALPEGADGVPALPAPSAPNGADPNSTALVIPGSESANALDKLNGADYLLIGTGTSGLIMLTIPAVRWYGLATLLTSGYMASTYRPPERAKLLAITSGTLALAATNPVAVASAGLGFIGTAANATINSASAAFQLSTTVVGALVTTSGAVVAYLLSSSGEASSNESGKNKKKKRKRNG